VSQDAREHRLAALFLAALHTELGEPNLARASLAELMHFQPDFSIARIPRLPAGRDFLVENLREAGVFEE
jgi:hypothetical protein